MRKALGSEGIKSVRNGDCSALTLLMTGVLADHPDHIVAADDLAGFTKTFDGSSDFHAEMELKKKVSGGGSRRW